MIDLRSDTVTRPTAEMRRAMANALVGDGVIDIDPTVDQLERETAAVLGKEAALFMPSGTMTNQVGVRVHCDRGSEFLCEADCHIYHYEQGAFAQLSGLVAHTIAGDGGVLTVDHLIGTIRPINDHMVRTQLLCLENTHNRWGGRVIPQETIDAVCFWARENGLKTHLDGARIWNASAATGIDVARMVAPFDSVSVCFSKGLGAPVGSALVGTQEFINEARRARKLFGGGMRQACTIIAADCVLTTKPPLNSLTQSQACRHCRFGVDASTRTSSCSMSIRCGGLPLSCNRDCLPWGWIVLRLASKRFDWSRTWTFRMNSSIGRAEFYTR
jgi:threonine aldolase